MTSPDDHDPPARTSLKGLVIAVVVASAAFLLVPELGEVFYIANPG